jgi:hypothetical protein
VTSPEKPKKKFRKPNPLLTLLGLIFIVIGSQLFVPNSLNYYNWLGWSWNIFWWLWVFPFLFLKIYDWLTVRKRRNSFAGGGIGSSSPWVRLIGIILIATLLAILMIYFIFDILIPYLLSAQVR